MISGIYCIENLVNGKKYIGQGLNIKKRMFAKHTNCIVLDNAIKKYGKENFKKYVLLYCEPDKNILAYYEIACIKIFYSHISENGYNISWGGKATMTGYKHSKKAKRKMSKAHFEKNLRGENSPLWGRHLPEKHKKSISEGVSKEKNWNYHRIRSDEHRKKLSESHLGKKNIIYGKKRPNSTSAYFGVSKCFDHYKWIYWVAQITENGKAIHIGQAKLEIDAAKLYDKYIIKNNLPRPLNFPQ
jgi:group I intron endonuclease